MENRTDICRYGASIFAQHRDLLAAQLGYAQNPEMIEPVHQIRVACRRLRTTLKDFRDCLSDENAKEWNQQFRQLASALGPLREQDVLILELETRLLHQKTHPGRRALQLLLDYCQIQRRVMQQDMIAAIDEFSRSDLLPNLNLYIDNLTQIEPQPASFSPAFRQFAQEKINLHIDRAFNQAWCLDSFKNKEAIHKMRIILKDIRYSIEAFAPLHPEQFRVTLEQFRELQDLFGTIHDHYMWTEYLKALQFSPASFFFGLKTRQLFIRWKWEEYWIFRRIKRVWKHMRHDGFWERLRESLLTAPGN